MAKSNITTRLWAAIIFIFFHNNVIAQENSVSIGTEELKESAVLWLNGNGSQGFLLPAVSNTSDVVTSDIQAGMMVFQTSDNKIYWYNGTVWNEIGSGSGGNGKAYTLELNENNLILKENGADIVSTVPVAANATLNNKQVLTWDGNKWIAAFIDRLYGFNVENPTGQAGDKVLTWDGNSWILRNFATSGIQNLTGVLAEGNDGGGAGIKNIADPVLAQDAATKAYVDANNTADAMSASIYDTDGNTVVDNADSLNGQYGSYYLERANHTGTQDVSTITGIVDNDDTNEFQSISLSGSTLSLSDDPVNPSGLDLSSINTDNQTAAEVIYDPAVSGLTATDVKAAIDELAAAPDSDNQSLSYDGTIQSLSLTNGGSVTINVDDADASPINEIQDISFDVTNNILSLTEPGQPDQTVDLNRLLDNTDSQSLSFSGSVGSTIGGEVFNLDISGGAGVKLKEGANISMTRAGTELTIEAISGLTTVATDGTTITGDGRSSNPLLVPSGAITSAEIANGSIIDEDVKGVSPQKLLQSGANSGEVLKWDGSQWAPSIIRTDGATITGDGEAAPFSVGVINTVNMATGSVTADKVNVNVAGYGLTKTTKGDLAVDGAVVALDADLGTMATQDAGAVNITGGTLDNVTITNGTYSGDGSGLTGVNALIIAGEPVDATMAPAKDDVLKWDGSQWVAAPDATETSGLLSDRNAKKEITGLTYGLNDILKLKPVSYKYKKGNSNVRLGLIAQDVQPVIPEVVKNMNADFLGITYIDLLPVAIKAIQEQQKIIDKQQKEIDELKERLTEAKEAPSDYKNLQLQIDGLKAKLEQFSNLLNAEAKNK